MEATKVPEFRSIRHLGCWNDYFQLSDQEPWLPGDHLLYYTMIYYNLLEHIVIYYKILRYTVIIIIYKNIL